MRLLSLFFLSILAFQAWAQSPSARFALDPLGKVQEEMASYLNDLHGAQQPFVSSLDTNWRKNDSLFNSNLKQIKISPSGSFDGGFNSGDGSNGIWQASPGIEIGGSFAKNFEFGGTYRYHREWSSEYIREYVDSLRVIPGVGFATKDEYGYAAHYSEFYLGYQAGKYFHFEAGRGKQFFGDGYRSVLFSTNAAPFPYFRLTSRIWKFRYIMQITRMTDITGISEFKDARHKHMVLHALSFNPIPQWNISLYEMVIWQDRDSLSDRGVEFNYLNPLIFFRPIEYAQGSADNVLLGLSTKVKLRKKQHIYAGVMLDEFLLDQQTNKLGWWAYKFALQYGFRSFDTFTEGLHFQGEFVKTRPFTYTHGSVLQNYGHINQSLAHPLGTNFKEVTFLSRYEMDRWSFLLTLGWAEYGRDIDGENYGGNIFRSYENPFRNYGNYITQGRKHHLWWQNIQATYNLNKNNMELFGMIGARELSVNYSDKTELWIRLGIRTSMSPRVTDF